MMNILTESYMNVVVLRTSVFETDMKLLVFVRMCIWRDSSLPWSADNS